ncbi:MAG: phage tail protein [Verrucomicrobiales bacterium]|nr:phage tail protein [Verrucomicrobiales bacterium]
MKRHEIERLLPSIFQRTLRTGSPLDSLLEIMEALHAPAEGVLARFDTTCDPRRTPDDFVPFLARWVDLERIFEPETGGASAGRRPPVSTGAGRLRELTAAAAWLSKWRGTARGLRRFLHTATGDASFEIPENIRENVDSKGQSRLFHLVVYAPATLRRHEALIERIIQSEKPAYVTSELVFRGEGEA